MKTILNLVPNPGKSQKELRATVDLLSTSLSALLMSLAQVSPLVIGKMQGHLLRLQQDAIAGDPANREQQDAINKAIELIDALDAVAHAK